MTMTNSSGKQDKAFVNSLTNYTMKDDKLSDMLEVNQREAHKSVIPQS